MFDASSAIKGGPVSDPGLDQPESDVIEQNQDAIAGQIDEREPSLPDEIPIEADVADVAEQARELPADDDEYR